MSILYLDDLTPGQTFEGGSETPALTPEAIKHYAEQYDPQPFHLDEAAATKSFFGGLAASGWHTASLTMSLIARDVPLAGGIIGAGVEEMRWPRPVRPGDRLRIVSEVLEVRVSKSKPEQGLAKIRTTTLNHKNEPVQVMTANLVVPRRPASGHSRP